MRLSRLTPPKEAAPSFLHCVLFRVDAAWPRLGRAFRTAPVSRQTIKQERFGTHRAFTHALPPSFGLRSVPFAVPVLFLPAAAQVKEETSQKRQKGKNNEIRRSQRTNQRGRSFPRRSAGVRSQ